MDGGVSPMGRAPSGHQPSRNQGCRRRRFGDHQDPIQGSKSPRRMPLATCACNQNMVTNISQSAEAVERQHGGTATLAQSVPVKETHAGAVVWEGVVHIFDVTGHPKAIRGPRLVISDRGERQTAVLCGTTPRTGDRAGRGGTGRDRGGATGQTMITLSYLLGVLAAIGVIISGVYSYKAAGTEPQAAWDFDPQLRPKNFQQHAFGMVNALERAMFISGSHGKKAAFWGMASGVLGLLAAICAWLS